MGHAKERAAWLAKERGGKYA